MSRLRQQALERARRGGASRWTFEVVRALVTPPLKGWFRLRARGARPATPSGPLILAANHRSVLDPIVVGLLAGRPVYFMAKQELFRWRPCAKLLGALGAFPVERGAGDTAAIQVAEEILDRGECLVIFPEGRCMPPGPLGAPRSGVGRLAQATGAAVVPIAITGTEATNVRRVPPRRIRVRIGPTLRFERMGSPTPGGARAATERIWGAVTAAFEELADASTTSPAQAPSSPAS